MVTFDVQRVDAPIDPALLKEVFDFWNAYVDKTDEDYQPVYGPSEVGKNQEILYLVRSGKQLVGSSHLSISEMDRRLGGVGGVVTDEAFRGRGIAHATCSALGEDFVKAGGQAAFMGTGNPVAARVYERIEYHTVNNTNVMGYLANGGSLEDFFDEYFSHPGPVKITPGSTRDRVTVIPLLLAPHETKLLDANVEFFSRKHVHQPSCMGLYWRLNKRLLKDDSGTWFCAYTNQGCMVGLSTARQIDAHEFQVDGVVHANFSECLDKLLDWSIEWATARGGRTICARIAKDDPNKLSRFTSLGFTATGRSEPIACGEGEIDTVWVARETQR